MKYCEHCGADLAVGDEFCWRCGKTTATLVATTPESGAAKSFLSSNKGKALAITVVLAVVFSLLGYLSMTSSDGRMAKQPDGQQANGEPRDSASIVTASESNTAVASSAEPTITLVLAEEGIPPESSRPPASDDEFIGSYVFWRGTPDRPNSPSGHVDSVDDMPVPYPASMKLLDDGTVELAFTDGSTLAGHYAVMAAFDLGQGRRNYHLWIDMSTIVFGVEVYPESTTLSLTVPDKRLTYDEWNRGAPGSGTSTLAEYKLSDS